MTNCCFPGPISHPSFWLGTTGGLSHEMLFLDIGTSRENSGVCVLISTRDDSWGLESAHYSVLPTPCACIFSCSNFPTFVLFCRSQDEAAGFR